jgi:beta-phosphoglucomutase-like phosphatase (HAD superfamily)
MNIRGVLWDMDGVLVDTRDLHYRTWEKIFLERGDPFSYELFHKTFGMKNAEILPLWLGRPLQAKEIEQISNAKEARFRQAARGQVMLLPGVHHWLGHFQLWGYSQAVASSASEENIEMLVTELGIRRYFQALVSASVLPGKPDPAVFVRAAQQIHLPPERCLVIEDSVAGVEAARRAGMKCIAVTTTHPPAALSAASLVVERLDKLSDAHLRALCQD